MRYFPIVRSSYQWLLDKVLSNKQCCWRQNVENVRQEYGCCEMVLPKSVINNLFVSNHQQLCLETIYTLVFRSYVCLRVNMLIWMLSLFVCARLRFCSSNLSNNIVFEPDAALLSLDATPMIPARDSISHNSVAWLAPKIWLRQFTEIWSVKSFW